MSGEYCALELTPNTLQVCCSHSLRSGCHSVFWPQDAMTPVSWTKDVVFHETRFSHAWENLRASMSPSWIIPQRAWICAMSMASCPESVMLPPYVLLPCRHSQGECPHRERSFFSLRMAKPSPPNSSTKANLFLILLYSEQKLPLACQWTSSGIYLFWALTSDFSVTSPERSPSSFCRSLSCRARRRRSLAASSSSSSFLW